MTPSRASMHRCFTVNHLADALLHAGFHLFRLFGGQLAGCYRLVKAFAVLLDQRRFQRLLRHAALSGNSCQRLASLQFTLQRFLIDIQQAQQRRIRHSLMTPSRASMHRRFTVNHFADALFHAAFHLFRLFGGQLAGCYRLVKAFAVLLDQRRLQRLLRHAALSGNSCQRLAGLEFTLQRFLIDI